VIRDPAAPSALDGFAVRWFLASVMHPLDIHVFAPAEFEAAASGAHSLAAHIAQQAKLYYWTEGARKHVPSLLVRVKEDRESAFGLNDSPSFPQ
jgi:hypothetical protein